MMFRSELYPRTGNPEERNFYSYFLDQRILEATRDYSKQYGIEYEGQICDIAAEVTKIVNGFIKAAQEAVQNGQKTCLYSYAEGVLSSKFDQLIQVVAASILNFKVTPHRIKFFLIECPNVEPYQPNLGNSFANFQTFRENGFLTDVTLKCQTGECRAHRVVLAARSDYFRKAFENPMKESQDSPFTIDVEAMGSDKGHLDELIDFLYTDHVHLKGRTLDDIYKLLILAHAYQVDGLIQACVYAISTLISEKTAQQIGEIGEKHCIQQLTNLSKLFLLKPLPEPMVTIQK